MKKLKCWIFGHKYRLDTFYSRNVQKLKCDRCGEYFGINHDVRAVLPWDNELEECMNIMYPNR